MIKQLRRTHRTTAAAAILAAAVAVSITPAHADTFTWAGNTGNFSDPTQWTGAVAPAGNGANDSFTFLGAGSYTATDDVPNSTSRSGLYFGSIQLANSAGTTTIPSE